MDQADFAAHPAPRNVEAAICTLLIQRLCHLSPRSDSTKLCDLSRSDPTYSVSLGALSVTLRLVVEGGSAADGVILLDNHSSLVLQSWASSSTRVS